MEKNRYRTVTSIIVFHPDTTPVHQPSYRAVSTTRQYIRKEVVKMTDADVIKPTSTERASPAVLELKKNGTLRFCIEYRRLNILTVRDAYPIPQMYDCIESQLVSDKLAILSSGPCVQHKIALISGFGVPPR